MPKKNSISQLTKDLEEETALRERLAALLDRVAYELKGIELPLTLHDWADLPVLARNFRQQLQESNGVIKVLSRAYPATTRRISILNEVIDRNTSLLEPVKPTDEELNLEA